MLLSETDFSPEISEKKTRDPKKSRAEIQKAYRDRKREKGEVAPSGKSVFVSKWAAGEFIALDGEGENVGTPQKFKVGSDKTEYVAARHVYTLISASTGESCYNKKGIETQSAIDFLLDLASDHPKAIFVIFAGGYDINHILLFGFRRNIIKKISDGENYEYEHNGVSYSIEYRARKSLMLRRGGEWHTDKKGQHHHRWKERIIIWDVFGFFQESFTGVMLKWLGKDHTDYKFICEMKAQRGDFKNVSQEKINRYNQAETSALVQIMGKLRDGVAGLDLKLNRWDGAGSGAAAMFRKHGIKQYKADMEVVPQGAQYAARCAYAGGRIEICKIGFHDGEVFDYDIASAYPSVMKNLPCLKCGSWRRGRPGTAPPPGFTLVKCEYDFKSGEKFYPLFFRTKRMQISFPSDGCGWYWFPEYAAALDCPGNVNVLDWWTYETNCDHRPFNWIEGYYETRKQFIKNPAADWQRGAEKIIKLFLNSLYGKCAQQLGGTDTQPPSYHQIEWAGYITSHTRARLYSAARSNPQSIIGFATDGIFTTQRLDALGIMDGAKGLGTWEVKQPMPQGMTIAMAGVYWWHFGENKFSHFSRGFDKDTMRTPHKILEAWAKGESEIKIPSRRLIGMGTACTSDSFWDMRGRFAECTRALRLDGYSHKRAGIDVRRKKPHRHLVDLIPKPNAEYGYDEQRESWPYPIKWAEGDGNSDAYENDLEKTREIEDTHNI